MLLLAVIYIVFISLGLPDSLFGVSWPVVHTEFGLPENIASLYSIVMGACTGGVSFVAGKLIRKFGTGKVTFLSTLLTVIGLIGISFSTNIFLMMFFSIILGFGAGAIDTGLNNYVSLHYKARHMNWLHCFWGVGVTLSPIIMSFFLADKNSSWRNGYRAIALIQFFIALIVLFTLNKWNVEPKTETDKNDVIDIHEKGVSELLRIKGVAVSIFSLGLYCSGEFMIGTWGATYAINVFAISPDEAAKWVSLYYGGIMLGRIISGFVADKLSDNTLIKTGAICAAVGIIILILPVGAGSLFGLLLVGIGYGPIFPSVLHSVPSRFGIKYSADITGYHMGGAYGIGFAVQLIYGYVASATSFAITPYILLALIIGVFVATLFTLKMIRVTKNKAYTET